MRLIKVSAPEGKGKDVIQVAFSAGIKEVLMEQFKFYRACIYRGLFIGIWID